MGAMFCKITFMVIFVGGNLKLLRGLALQEISYSWLQCSTAFLFLSGMNVGLLVFFKIRDWLFL